MRAAEMVYVNGPSCGEARQLVVTVHSLWADATMLQDRLCSTLVEKVALPTHGDVQAKSLCMRGIRHHLLRQFPRQCHLSY